MAIDFWRPDDTDAWVNSQKTFYRTGIYIGHPQLRHLISSPSPGIIYFVDRKKVYCLDTATNTRILVTELVFDAICTASGHGWFCAGGETHGYFAAMRIPDMHKTKDLEDHLPDCPERPTLLEQLDSFYHALPPRVRIERLGELIVNSISIHRLQGRNEADEEEVVAVLTNNDHTVRIYSLTRDMELRAEKFDFPMNHATISPDGTTLMIVGDKEVAYFYKKTPKPIMDTGGSRNRSGDSQHGSWVLLRELRLHKPPEVDVSPYFTTAWSPTGKFCATASENGTITLIETDALQDEERNPIVTVISSSRPESPLGGVRTLCFAPHPWDLLMWSEDQGRMCVADLRNGLSTCQVIDLDHASAGVTTIGLLDGNVASRSFRSSEVMRYTEMLSANAQRQRYLQLPGISTIGSDAQGLTEEEQQILDGLRTTRQREEAVPSPGSNPSVTPRSINYSALRRFQRHHMDSTAVDPNADPWRIIEAAMQPARPTSAPNRANAPNQNNLTTDDDDDDMTPVGVSGARDNPSPRTRTSIPTNRQTSDSLRLDSEAAYRDYRQRVAELDATTTWRSRTAQSVARGAVLSGQATELDAEIEAAQRQRMAYEAFVQTANTDSTVARRRLDAELQSVNASAARLLATGLTSVEREITDQRSRVLDLAATSAEINAERRRRMREASLRTPTTSSPRESALTTRGEAVLAREQRERERTEPSGISHADARREAREMSLQAIRNLRRAGDEPTRRARVRGVRSGALNSDAGLGTTGIAWGDASTVYVGTEHGIFELRLNFEQRKFWPAVERR